MPVSSRLAREEAVTQSHGREVLHPGESGVAHLLEEHFHQPGRVGAAHTGQNRGVLNDGQNLAGHLHYDGIGVAVGHAACKRAAPVHAEAAGVVNDQQVDAAGFLALGADTIACASSDYRHSLCDAFSQTAQHLLSRECHDLLRRRKLVCRSD